MDERLLVELPEPRSERVNRSLGRSVVALRINRDHDALEIAELMEEGAVRAHERPLGRDERVGVAVDPEMERAEPRAEDGERDRRSHDRARPTRHERSKPLHHGCVASVSALLSRRAPKSVFFPRRARSPTVAVGL